MLDYMRAQSRSFIIYFFFTILIVVFVFQFGPQSGGWTPEPIQDVAEVAGEPIDQTELEMEYLRNYGWGYARNQELAQVLAEKKDLLDHIVSIRLLAKEAADLGLVATPAETRAYIQDSRRNFDYRSFAPEGKFDADQYQNIILNGYQSSLRRYETARQRDLLARQLVQFLGAQVRPPEAEVRDEWLLRESKVNVEFVAFRPDAEAAPPEPTAAEADAFATAEGQAVKAWYEGHKDDFVRPKEVLIRQVFVRGPRADEEARAKAKEKAALLHKRIVEGEDLAAVATAESDHVSYKDKGGDMGWQRKGNNDPDFDAAAFALDKGALSDVVETEIGFFILRAEDVRAEADTSLADATAGIARKMLIDRRRAEAARVRAEGLIANVAAGTGWAEAVAALAPAPAGGAPDGGEGGAAWTVEETGEFSREGGTGGPDPLNPFRFARAWDSVPRVGRSPGLVRAAFALTEEAPLAATPIQVGDTWYAIRLKARTVPDEAQYASARDAVREELAADRGGGVLGPWERALFTPKSGLRFFGGAPKVGPWLANVLDDARAKADIEVDDSVFQVQAAAEPTDRPVN